jgi:uncharacterized delta-60 repeat protein/uncharacterized repeat protein (TIGR01451 family)
MHRLRSRLAGALVFSIATAVMPGARPALAADGDLDPSFGSGGVTSVDVGGSDFSTDVAVQSDGRIVVVGYTNVPPEDRAFAIARFDADGNPDTTFSSDGVDVRDLTAFDDLAQAVVIQPDQKIVVAGFTGPGGFMALLRYNTNGTLDGTFDGDGIAQAQTVGGLDDRLYDVALQPDGKIVAVGAELNPASDAIVSRWNTDGTLDATFGTGGIVKIDQGGIDGAFAVALQADGRIVTAGSSSNVTRFALSRLLTGGTLDTSFGTGGTVSTDLGGSDGAQALGVAIQGDGRIVASGYKCPTGTCDFATVRYEPSGAPDTTFGSGGVVVTNFGGYDQGADIALQADGKVVVSGSDSSSRFGIARYTTSGVPDASFGGGDGLVSGPSGTDGARGVAIQADGKIVAAGKTTLSEDIQVARYLASLAPPPELSVSQSHDPEPVTQGSDVRFSILVSNAGPGDATGVQLADALPTNGTFVSASSSQGTCAPPASGALSCALGTLADGASATVDVYVTANPNTGSMTNGASLMANEHPQAVTAAPEIATVSAPAAGTVDAACPPSGCTATTGSGSGPTPTDPAVTQVVVPPTPDGATVSVDTNPATSPSDQCGAGQTCYGPVITVLVDETPSSSAVTFSAAGIPDRSTLDALGPFAAAISATNPLRLTFSFDTTIPRGGAIKKAKIFLNGVLVPDCARRPPGVASPAPACVSQRTLFKNGDYSIVVFSTVGGTWRH